MEKIVDLVSTDAAANDISQSIKDVLYNKASEKIENMRSTVASQMFDTEINQGEE